MRLLRYGPPGEERPGLLDGEGRIRDLGPVTREISAEMLGAGLLGRLAELDVESLEIAGGRQRIGPPVANVGKVVCVGLNYRDHAEESRMEVPDEPVLFMKAATAVSGPDDPIVLPEGYSKVDWEVELGVVIGRTARSVPEASAYDYVAGYCVAHDVSERAFQLERGGQWVKGKSCDTFAPLGPWLVTRDEVNDPHALSIWLEVNGKRRQDSNTRLMIFSVPMLVSYISRFMTLSPGDVLMTGTPPGVALGQQQPVFLQPGDRVRLGIDGLGVQEQQVVESGGGR